MYTKADFKHLGSKCLVALSLRVDVLVLKDTKELFLCSFVQPTRIYSNFYLKLFYFLSCSQTQMLNFNYKFKLVELQC